MKKLAILMSVAASPAFAASGPFFSLFNTNFVVLIAFLLFVGVLLYVKVPAILTKMLDARAEAIQKELDEAKALREEAQTILASYERKQQEVQEQASRIVEHAKMEAAEAAEKAKEDLKKSIARRIAAAEDQLKSAETAAVKEVRDRAVQVAIAAAGEVIASQMSASKGNTLINDSLHTIKDKLH